MKFSTPRQVNGGVSSRRRRSSSRAGNNFHRKRSSFASSRVAVLPKVRKIDPFAVQQPFPKKRKTDELSEMMKNLGEITPLSPPIPSSLVPVPTTVQAPVVADYSPVPSVAMAPPVSVAAAIPAAPTPVPVPCPMNPAASTAAQRPPTVPEQHDSSVSHVIGSPAIAPATSPAAAAQRPPEVLYQSVPRVNDLPAHSAPSPVPSLYDQNPSAVSVQDGPSVPFVEEQPEDTFPVDDEPEYPEESDEEQPTRRVSTFFGLKWRVVVSLLVGLLSLSYALFQHSASTTVAVPTLLDEGSSLLLVDTPTFDERVVSDVIAYGSVVSTEDPVNEGSLLTDEPTDQLNDLPPLLVDIPTCDEQIVSDVVAYGSAAFTEIQVNEGSLMTDELAVDEMVASEVGPQGSVAFTNDQANGSSLVTDEPTVDQMEASDVIRRSPQEWAAQLCYFFLHSRKGHNLLLLCWHCWSYFVDRRPPVGIR